MSSFQKQREEGVISRSLGTVLCCRFGRGSRLVLLVGEVAVASMMTAGEKLYVAGIKSDTV